MMLCNLLVGMKLLIKENSALVNMKKPRTVKDVTKSLHTLFSGPKIPLSLPSENRRLLQSFIDEHDGEVGEEESLRANLDFKAFWEKYVVSNPQWKGAFVGVLKELRAAIVGDANILEWWELAVKPVITGTGYKKLVQEDAREFAVGAMTYDNEAEVSLQRPTVSQRLCSDLLHTYLAQSSVDESNDQFAAPESAQTVQQVEDVLVAFGRKRPRDLFHCIDDLVEVSNTRLQALTLLSSFLRHQTPHLYLVINTPLVEDLLKCLMNDTSTTILSVALTSLIMLLPHIPGSLGPYLPRLFLIYSRLLCWEKFSELSNEAQKSLVTDDRISRDADEGQDQGDELEGVGIDITWERARPQADALEAETPELMTYFTYLYGLYPLNFVSYIRKPRRYLKAIDFPGADGFDLDQAVIRSRTEQFRQVHLLHPNFYNMSAEEELVDPKWPKMDPADVVGECHGLRTTSKYIPDSPGQPPTGKLPDLPPVPPSSVASLKASGQISPVASHASFRSGNSWRDTQSTAVSVAAREGDSPIIKRHGVQSDDETLQDRWQPLSPEEKPQASMQTNIVHLQRQITLLRNELNFEKWHKAQIATHVGQIMRRNVKEATVDAETLNLINANRALKKQLEQAKKAREATIKDSALTRKQANNLETHMTDRFNKFKTEQETWQADADELRRLRMEMKHYRELLVATEARELNKSHQLELAQRDVEEMKKVQAELQDARHRIHEYEYREFEFETATRERDILKNETDGLRMRMQRHEDDRERIRHAYSKRVAELESQLMTSDAFTRSTSRTSSNDTHANVQHAVAESQSKLAQLKKAYSRLLEKHTDLELEYQHIKGQLEALQGDGNSVAFYGSRGDGPASSFGESDIHSWSHDVVGEYTALQSTDYGVGNTNDHSGYRAQSATPLQYMPSQMSQATMHRAAGLTFRPATRRKSSLVSKSSGTPVAINQSAPLNQDETKSAFSNDSSGSKKEKIKPDSNVRVYGRGKPRIFGFSNDRNTKDIYRWRAEHQTQAERWRGR